jgi:site-specific DNA-methyltransferase (adenine-specific)
MSVKPQNLRYKERATVIKPYYEEELVTIYQDDCLGVLSSMESKSIDLILTDPPYGIGADKGVGGFGVKPDKARSYSDKWDIRPDKKVFDEMIRVSKQIIIFGGNFFTDYLPVSGHWIVWDKKGDIPFKNPYSDCELVWTSFDKVSNRKFTCIQQGFISEEKQRYHPTQKPVRLFTAILTTYLHKKIKPVVLDPFLGSGTTCIAAKQLCFRSIGIEISKHYCQIAINRLEKEGNNPPVYPVRYAA